LRSELGAFACSATRPQPAEVSKPQSVPASTRAGSLTTSATLETVRHHLRMLDEISQAVDHAGNQELIVLERILLEAAKFVRVAWIGERQHETADLRLPQGWQNILERYIAVVR
jgi:hypothetical protein